MINENTGSNTENRRPFLLRPASKDYLWGGSRLKDDFSKSIEVEPLAETWECSTHPNGLSYVASGNMQGMSLKEVLLEHPDYVGKHPNFSYNNTLPILIKLIDADKDLSIQVHPDDEYADKYENGQQGKTEMWYVLDAVADAHLIYGLNREVNKEELRAAIEGGNIEKYLQKIPVKKNDVFFIQPGIIHAIGAGVLLAEIQQNSDITYRLYDYGRKDKDGKERTLHIDKALDVAMLKESTKPKQPLRVLRYKPGVAYELIARCKYFEVSRMIINTERRQKVCYRADELSFRVLLCVNGCGVMSYADEVQNVYKGDCYFVPADSADIIMHGKMTLLDIKG